MSQQPQTELRILLLEDDPQDAEMVAGALTQINPSWVVRRVETESDYTNALEAFAPEIILSDHALRDLDANQAMQLAQSRRPGRPFILVSAVLDQTAAECLKAGAADFVGKSDLSRLGPAIRSALEIRAPLRKLSSRQLEVLQLLAAGNSTREIAEQLKVSVKTVETHRAEVMRRLGIRELAGLVRYSVRVGLVSANQ